MNESTSIPEPQRRPDVDGLLRAYFQAALPRTWPRPPLPASPREQAPASPWRRSRMRLMLAASMALLLTGYLGLAGRFPQTAPPTRALELNGPHIGDRPIHRPRAA